jgi:hypothetical protein
VEAGSEEYESVGSEREPSRINEPAAEHLIGSIAL